jgi:hypothetical protein
MFHLIATVLAIALVAALSVTSLNYLPSWQVQAKAVAATSQVSLGALQQAYDIVTRTQNGVPPAVTTAQDGGFNAGFMSALRFTPTMPPGYAWTYGVHVVDGSQWSGLNYFCMKPLEGNAGASEGLVRGLARTATTFSADQLFFSDSCGATQDWASPTTYPAALHLTFFVAYTPGISR